MTTTIRRGLTLERFLEREETKPASEYACGEAFRKPMPNRQHAALQGYLLVTLYQFLARTGLGRVFPELRCIFGPPGLERAYVPDLVFIAAARLTDDFYHMAAPDLAVEVLSPRQNVARFADKIAFYLLNGVRVVWIVDPGRRAITVLTPDGVSRTLMAGQTLDGGDLLPGFSVTVDGLLAQLRAEPPRDA